LTSFVFLLNGKEGRKGTGVKGRRKGREEEGKGRERGGEERCHVSCQSLYRKSWREMEENMKRLQK